MQLRSNLISSTSLPLKRDTKLSRYIQAKSFCISREVNNFFETEIQIWAGFGPIGDTEKKIGDDCEQLSEGGFFMFSWANKISNISKPIH